MSETLLTQREIKDRLRALRDKYGCSDHEFRTNPDVRNRVSGEDEFEWEAYLIHLATLRECEERVHREYLSHGVSASQPKTEKYKISLAA